MTKTNDNLPKILTKTGSIVALALIALLPFERIPSFDIQLFNNVLTLRLNTVAAFLLIILTLPVVWEKRRELIKMPYLGIGAFVFFYILSTGLAVDYSRALLVLAFTLLAVSSAISISFYVSDEFLKKAKVVLYWATWVVLIFGFYQYLGDVFGLPAAWTGLRSDYTKVVFGFPRIQSTGLEPLYYANFLMIPLFVFAADFVKGENARPVLLWAIVTQLCLTVSRGAFAGALVGGMLLLVFALRAIKNRKRLLSLALLVLAGVLSAYLLTGLEVKKPAALQEKSEHKTQVIVQQATNFDTQPDRDLNRELAWNVFRINPMLGIGPGGMDKYLRAHVEAYQGTDGRLIANNETLELLAEGGLFSFMALAISLFWLVWKAVKRVWFGGEVEPEWPWMVGLVCYLVALAVQYQTFSTLYIMHVWVAIGILMGCLRKPEAVPKKPARRKAKAK